jgi:branched-chain amino acid transport system permease protein
LTALFNVLVAGLLLGGTYALVAVGLNLVFGVVRVINFAHGELVMLGMYGAYVAYQLGLDPYLSVLIVAPLMALLGLAIQRLLIQPLQTEPMMQVFVTFGLLLLLQNVVLAATGGQAHSLEVARYSRPIPVLSTSISVPRLIVLVVATLVTLGLYQYLQRSMIGRAIRAVVQDRNAARLMGINVERIYMLVFGLAAAMAGVAGVLLSPTYTITPYIGGDFIFAAFAVVTLGGLGSVPGAYIGAMVVGFVEALAGFYIDPALRQAVWFALFLVVLIIRPTGLLGARGAAELGLR